MPINQSHELEGAYEQHGVEADFIVVHGAAHGGDAFYSPANVDRVVTFLDEQLRTRRTRSSYDGNLGRGVSAAAARPTAKSRPRRAARPR